MTEADFPANGVRATTAVCPLEGSRYSRIDAPRGGQPPSAVAGCGAGRASRNSGETMKPVISSMSPITSRCFWKGVEDGAAQ